MNKDFDFLIAIHFHQPVGNFDHVMHKACDRCYDPFLDSIAEFGDLKFNLHYSGCLLEWLKKHRPGTIERISSLVKAGQVEILGGGFYEPILAVLPPKDRIEQLVMFSQFLSSEFGTQINGAWLTERIWEPNLVEAMCAAGLKYTIVDDTHLRYAGLTQDQLYGYYVTEDNGECLSIFPSDKTLRYAIPFHPQQETLDYFGRIRGEFGKNAVLYGDDGEKFGEWPGTEEWVYHKKWLYNFLIMLRDNSHWVRTRKISDYMKEEPAAGRVYLPTASYHEMSEWALPSGAAQRLEDITDELKREGKFDRYSDFIRGGFWRNFFTKYAESNQMHKRMVFTSKRLRKYSDGIKAAKKDTQKASESEKLVEAKKSLFRSQCNCAYWHGVFGGLYLYHLRSAIYQNIINADRILDSLEHKGDDWIEINESDFDADLHNEFIVSTPCNTFVIDPYEGAAITGWDIKERSINILNTFSRRPEAYHRKLKELAMQKAVKDNPATIHDARFVSNEIASRELCYDKYRRALFIDHFVLPDVSIEQLSSVQYEDLGDFASGGYRAVRYDSGRSPFVTLEKIGHVNKKPVKIVKEYFFSPRQEKISVRYDITNLFSEQVMLNFAPEMNFALTQDSTKEELDEMDTVMLQDSIENVKINAVFSDKAEKIFRFCVKTVSQSEKDIEENYQASCVMPVFHFKLGAGKNKVICLDIEAKTSGTAKKEKR